MARPNGRGQRAFALWERHGGRARQVAVRAAPGEEGEQVALLLPHRLAPNLCQTPAEEVAGAVIPRDPLERCPVVGPPPLRCNGWHQPPMTPHSMMVKPCDRRAMRGALEPFSAVTQAVVRLPALNKGRELLGRSSVVVTRRCSMTTRPSSNPPLAPLPACVEQGGVPHDSMAPKKGETEGEFDAAVGRAEVEEGAAVLCADVERSFCVTRHASRSSLGSPSTYLRCSRGCRPASARAPHAFRELPRGLDSRGS